MTQFRNLIPPPIYIAVAASLLLPMPKDGVEQSIRMPTQSTPLQQGSEQEIELPSRGDRRAEVSEAVARPLFSPVRRLILSRQAPADVTVPLEPAVEVVGLEPEPPAEQAEVVQLSPPEIQLHGLISVGRVKQVLVFVVAESEERWLGIGDEVLGWQLSDISDTGARFDNGTQSFIVNIYE